jgi:hypothetical protein
LENGSGDIVGSALLNRHREYYVLGQLNVDGKAPCRITKRRKIETMRRYIRNFITMEL